MADYKGEESKFTELTMMGPLHHTALDINDACPIKKPTRGKDRLVKSYRWEGVSCSYGLGKCVLKEASGGLKSGQLLAILGPSGCGKTTLLDILTLRKSLGTIGGQIWADGCVVTEDLLGKHASYMPQDSLFLPMQTVEEALTFQVTMRLGRSMSREALRERVVSLLNDTGLGGEKAKRKIGGLLPGGLRIKGLSGGEKRRLSLCCSVINEPDILFCDEPTSGLDSRAALRVMKQIQGYCATGVICVTTIHQPRSAIWQGFDKVAIFSKGYQLYYGPRAGAEPWFQDLLQAKRNPETALVDWLLDIVNTDFEGLDGTDDVKNALTTDALAQTSSTFLSSPTFFAERASWDLHTSSYAAVADEAQYIPPKGGFSAWYFCYKLLLQRAIKNCFRNPGNLLARLACNVFVAFAAGLIFFQVAAKKKMLGPLYDVQVLTSLNMLIYGAAVTPFASISLFINDREFFSSDSASGLYPVSAYYVAQMTVEILMAIINATMYSGIVTALTGMMDLVEDPSLRLIRCIEMLGVVTFSSMVGTAIVQFFAVLAPNFDVAFILCASNITFALLSGGMIVFYPNMSKVSSWMPNLSFIRFLFQGLAQQLLRGTSHMAMVEKLDLTTPRGVLPNLGVGAIFYIAASFGTYLCLRYLHKEKR